MLTRPPKFADWCWSRVLSVAGSLLPALAVVACGTLEVTQLRDVWWSPPPAPFKSIAVVPMGSGPAERSIVDSAFLQSFAASGVQAIPGVKMIEGAGAADGSATMQALKASGAEAVLYIWLRRDDSRSTPGSNVQPSLGSWGWFGSEAEWYASPQQQRLMVGRFEARLYDLKSQRLVWSATTATFYPKSVDQDAPGVAKAVAGDLAKLGFTPRRP